LESIYPLSYKDQEPLTNFLKLYWSTTVKDFFHFNPFHTQDTLLLPYRMETRLIQNNVDINAMMNSNEVMKSPFTSVNVTNNCNETKNIGKFTFSIKIEKIKGNYRLINRMGIRENVKASGDFEINNLIFNLNFLLSSFFSFFF